LAKTFVKNNEVYCINKGDMSSVAKEIGVEFYPLFDIASFAKIDFDVILLSVSIISFDEVLRSLPKSMLEGKLIVDVLSVKVWVKG
jgi:prephenate dehydrogenase